MVKHVFKILQQMILNLVINLESEKFFKVCVCVCVCVCVLCVCDNFEALDIKVLKCQVYFKSVTYINNEETRLWNEQKKLWNMKYLYKWKNLEGYWKMHKKVLDLFKSHMKLNWYKHFNICKSLYFKKHLHISFD